MRDVARIVFSSQPNLDEDQLTVLQQFGIDPEAEDITCAFLSIVALVQKAMDGDLRAIELYLKIVGEDVFSINAKARLDFEKEQIKVLEVDDEEKIAGFNAQILSLADLIKNPKPGRELPT